MTLGSGRGLLARGEGLIAELKHYKQGRALLGGGTRGGGLVGPQPLEVRSRRHV